MIVTEAAGSGDANSQKPIVGSGLRANREQIVAQQVGTLIALASTYTNALKILVPGDEDASVGTKARYSLETTLMAVNNRVESILADESRWNMQNYDDLAIRLRELYSKQRELFETQQELAEAQMAPHNLLGAQYIKLPNGAWAVWVGNPQLPDGSLVAAGLTLKEAFQNFDAAFDAVPTDEQRRLYEQAKTWAVDGGGNGGIQPAAGAERQASDNRQGIEPKREIRNKPIVGKTKVRKGSRWN